MKRKTLGVLAVSVCFVALIAGVLFLTRSESCPFSMQVIPENTMNSIAGQRCVFLVVVADEGEGSGEGEAVNISATSPGATVTVSPQAITPCIGLGFLETLVGQVAEVTVVPDEASIGKTLTVNIKGKRGGLTQTEISTIVVEMGEDELKPYAAEMRDSFISWLAANYPEFGITGETEWTGTIVVPYTFEVSYYLYFSEDWEMGVRWHVTIVPDDWVEIYLRKRFTETQPSHAFKIDSYETYKRPEPHAIDPPESVWRTLPILSYPAIVATSAKSGDNEIRINVTTGSIPAMEWAYSVSSTEGSPYTWTTGDVELASPYVSLGTYASGTYYVSLKHIDSAHFYFNDRTITIS